MSEASPGSASAYRAFLSYSHADKAWADWLHKALETYRVPARLVGTKTTAGTVPRRLAPIFRDRDELASATDLGREVTDALVQSDALIVVCSRMAARSHWVNQEVLTFKRLGRGDRIFCLIVDGEPGVSDWPGHEAGECFCPALRHAVDAQGLQVRERTEPIAADVRPGKDGKATAKLKLVAGLLGVGFDDLAQRETHRRRRRMLVVTAASLAGMAVAATLAVNAYIARNEARQREAQTEAALNYMLGDLHQKLEGIGRLDLMASVTDKALALFAERKPGSLTDLELTQQSRALVQIGEIRLKQAHYGPAMEAFRRAYQRSVELTARHPENGRFLYDRAQAEYWIGNVYWQQRKLSEANTWLTRYRDSTRALLKLDPENEDWQFENTYGEQTLAVLAFERGDLDAAQTGFRAVLAAQQRLVREQPGNLEITAAVADTTSWLGTVAERRGDLAEAQRLLREQASQFAALRDRNPRDFRWLSGWANAQELLGASLATTGNHEESVKTLAAAEAAYRTLTQQEPNNVPWRTGMASVQIRRASQAFAEGHPHRADELLSAAMRRLQAPDASPAQRGDRLVHRVLSRGWLLRAHIASQRGDLQAAAEAADRSLAEARSETTAEAVDDGSLADRANALLQLGRVQQARSPDVPPPAWEEARKVLDARAPDSRYWRLLDPWLRLCRLTGDAAGARIALDRLDASGYAPQQPWPALADHSVSVAARGDHHAH